MQTDRISKALELFNSNNYEECVELLIGEYDKGVEKDWIKEFFYQNFITPNDNEFRENYIENAKDITSVEYEDCSIDFIPVSDVKYYLFSRQEAKFCGIIDLEVKVEQNEPDFHSLLIADTWDIREMIPFINQKRYQMVYIIVGEHRNTFASFFKLKGIVEKYLNNAILFSGIDEMKAFFVEYPSYYLPHRICSTTNEYYKSVIDELLVTRIKNVYEPREDVFLSICIPSYNRGHRVLECVKRLQLLPYDAEIEILVSDNGSTEHIEEYKEIEALQKEDSRIKYVKLPENKSYYGNICNLISEACGQFIMFASDEDIPVLERMEDGLNYLYTHSECGVGTFSHLGVNGRIAEEKYITNQYDRIVAALNVNYLTGTVLKNCILKETNALEILKANKENQFVWHYTHIALSILAAYKTYMFISDIVLWQEGKGEGEYEEIIKTFQADSRIQQGIDAVDFIRNHLRIPGDVITDIIVERMWKTYFLIGLAFYYYGKNEDYYSWFESCHIIHTGWCRYLDSLSIDKEERDTLKSRSHGLFWSKLKENPFGRWLDEDDVKIYSIVTMIAEHMEHKGKAISRERIIEISDKVKSIIEN